MQRSLIGSIIVALAIVAITIALVTAKLGPNAEEDDSAARRRPPGAGARDDGEDR